MGRQIKFKGKRVDNGEWITWSETYIHDGDGIWLSDENTDVVKVIPETVGQFTGLYDKNGKGIYEGDILGTDERTIGWVKGGVRGYCYDVVYINHPTGEKRWSLYETVEHDFPNKIEIIGNIYDNKELMEGTK